MSGNNSQEEEEKILSNTFNSITSTLYALIMIIPMHQGLKGFLSFILGHGKDFDEAVQHNFYKNQNNNTDNNNTDNPEHDEDQKQEHTIGFNTPTSQKQENENDQEQENENDQEQNNDGKNTTEDQSNLKLNEMTIVQNSDKIRPENDPLRIRRKEQNEREAAIRNQQKRRHSIP